MKTRDLIAALNREDPSGELDVCVGNTDIYFVSVEPAYYDGCQQVLKRDLTKRCYNIVGGEFRSQGFKLVLHPHSIWSAIFSNPELPVSFDSDYSLRHYGEAVEKERKEAVAIRDGCERQLFASYVKERLLLTWQEDLDEEQVTATAKMFAEMFIKHEDPLPSHVAEQWKPTEGKAGLSWKDRRFLQWDEEVEIEVNNGRIALRRKGVPEGEPAGTEYVWVQG